MKIAILSESFTKNMGYLGNILPRYLARFGATVHLVTLDLPVYYQLKDNKQIYSDFTGSWDMRPGSTETYDGYMLHVMAHKRLLGYMTMEGMRKKLDSIKPDIVYSLNAIGWLALNAALLRPLLGYKLFTGCHTTASVFPLAQRSSTFFEAERLKCLVTRSVPGRIVSIFTEKCYGATKDCAEIAVRFFGIEKSKIEICPLGVDTELFSPVKNEEERQARLQLREKLGFTPSDIVCIYSGRFSKVKNPLVLAHAVSRLASKGETFKALFVGNGEQADALREVPNCVVHPFVPVEALPGFYRASDVGVWPTQESTSMLDAAACSLPIIVNDTLIAVERIEGNGITYRLNDVNDMMRALLALRDLEVRRYLGEVGARRMHREFSWESIAERRFKDFEAALANR
jgi:glycosyltransferase involved in cell wall biosynthesis